MNHLEKKGCCGACHGSVDGCINSQCKFCHTPTPYSVLREKIKGDLLAFYDETNMPTALENIMSHIDEYRENLAKEVWHAQRKHVHTAGPAIPDNCNDCVFNNGIHTAKRIIRRT